MAKIILFSPAVSTLNRGDEIITQSCKQYIKYDTKSDYCIEISTHLPLLNNYLSIIGDTKIKIVLGSNLLRGKVNHKFKPWHIEWKNIKYLRNTVLMGVGWWTYNDAPNIFTRAMYKRILSKEYIHSVRDEYTKKMLEKIGIRNVINTGCPTMWKLTKNHCEKIPKEKSKNVVFTLTDYNRNIYVDRKMINILVEKYDNVFFWVQGWGDRQYLEELVEEKKNIVIIGSTLNEYETFLNNTDCDYVGTRLHAGIKAMQNLKRSIIIGIDNRALELKKDYNINCLEREKVVDELANYIDSSIITDIKLNEENIKRWLSQFK